MTQRLVVIGGMTETTRRASVSAWNGFVDCNSHSFPPLLYTHAQQRIPQNSLLLDGTLFPGGLSGKWIPVVVQWSPKSELTPAGSTPHSMIGTFLHHSRSRGIGLTLHDYRLMHWLSKARACDLSSNPRGDGAENSTS